MGFYAKAGKQKAVSEYLDKKILQKDPTFMEKSILKYKKGFKNYLDKFYVLGGILACMLCIIGIMNYFNTSATSIFMRKKELTLLEILGMTKKQVKRMLVYEGIFYITIGLFLALTVGSILGYYMVKRTVGEIYYFHTHTVVWPSLCLYIILLFMAVLIPMIQYRRFLRETVVERVRQE